MPTHSDYTIKVTVSQPSLTVNGVAAEDVSQEAIIAFGRWYKGDKGDKGDPGEGADIEYATNAEIDALFD